MLKLTVLIFPGFLFPLSSSGLTYPRFLTFWSGNARNSGKTRRVRRVLSGVKRRLRTLRGVWEQFRRG